MTGDLKVVADGVDEGRLEPPPRRPSWLWLLAGFVVGLGLAVVFVSAGSDVPRASTDAPTVPDISDPDTVDLATEPEAAEPEGIGEVVPGFPDTLVAVTQPGAGKVGYLVWPVAGPPQREPLPGFAASSVRFDESGRMVAMAADVPGAGGAVLSFGTPVRIRPIADDVTGYAWHDSEPGLLAYTQLAGGEEWLWIVDASRKPELVVLPPAVEGRLVAWGSWGFALQTETMVILLTAGGEFETMIEGRVLDSSPDGRLAVIGDGLRLVAFGEAVERVDVELDLIGSPELARFSPDGNKLVVVGGGGHLIIHLHGRGEPIHAPVSSGFPHLAWTSDSRFVVAPWIRGILIMDTEGSAQPHAELITESVIAVATIPLTDR